MRYPPRHEGALHDAPTITIYLVSILGVDGNIKNRNWFFVFVSVPIKLSIKPHRILNILTESVPYQGLNVIVAYYPNCVSTSICTFHDRPFYGKIILRNRLHACGPREPKIRIKTGDGNDPHHMVVRSTHQG
jgi:hypothetical protein